MASNQVSGAAALRYATALIDIAVESNAIDSVEKDMRELEAMLAASEDLQFLIRSPLVKRVEQRNAIVAVAKEARFNDLSANFLALLAENRRLPILPNIIHAVKTDLARRRGEVTANVQAAYTLSSVQTKALQDSLSKAMGRNVTLNVEIDRDLIGGMVVTVGSQMIDDSVKRKLERLRRAMQSQSNQNQSEKEEVS